MHNGHRKVFKFGRAKKSGRGSMGGVTEVDQVDLGKGRDGALIDSGCGE